MRWRPKRNYDRHVMIMQQSMTSLTASSMAHSLLLSMDTCSKSLRIRNGHVSRLRHSVAACLKRTMIHNGGTKKHAK